jgi:hypothetical protein
MIEIGDRSAIASRALVEAHPRVTVIPKSRPDSERIMMFAY